MKEKIEILSNEEDEEEGEGVLKLKFGKSTIQDIVLG